MSLHATPCLHLFTLVAWGAILPSLDVSPSQPLQLVLLRVGLCVCVWGGGQNGIHSLLSEVGAVQQWRGQRGCCMLQCGGVAAGWLVTPASGV